MPTQVIPVIEPDEPKSPVESEATSDTSSAPTQADEKSETNTNETKEPETSHPEETKTVPTSDSKVAVADTKQSPVDKALADYVHTPGTTHVSAFVSALDEAKKELAVAEGKVQEAEAALKAKLGIQ